MKNYNLRTLIFLALCCNLGLFAKRLISPVANIITDSLHIPGGLSTSFSLMFLVVAVIIVPRSGCATIMGLVQSVIALTMGMVGSMGALSFIGYIVPGMVIDGLFFMIKDINISLVEKMAILNAFAAMAASLTANAIVFHLKGIPLTLYLCVGATSGIACGFLGAKVVKPILPHFSTFPMYNTSSKKKVVYHD